MIVTLKDILQRRRTARQAPLTAEQRARSLLDAIDAGGVPLSPAIVNDIARKLGLEVAGSAPMDDTIQRIRIAVARL